VYVEFEDKPYLLDTGASHLFAKNAGVMGVELSKVDMGVLSHAHFDHSDGMAKFFALNKTAPFYLRKGAGENCYHAHKLIGRFTYHEYIGIHKGFLKRFADRIRFAEGDMQIAPNVYLVPHKTPGLSAIGERAHLSVKENGKYRYDSFDHEQSLVFDTPRGLFVMNSCSHGGADNIVKEIEATFPGKKIYALLGGFHLFRYKDDVVRAFAERLRELDVQKIYTGHCTGDRAFEILREVLGDRAEQMYTGMTVEI
jgi:7,8-dihydropterin-6-yl-methyl-4-(beta-D-ribofuranosyl)aminobenzene 5'-phosphate synthase